MSETVTITVERLKELEKYEAKAKAKIAKDTIRLAEFHKAHPEKNSECVNRYINKDRDAYNAKRRERRRLAKEAAVAVPGGGHIPTD
jgi:hypothetical protein